MIYRHLSHGSNNLFCLSTGAVWTLEFGYVIFFNLFSLTILCICLFTLVKAKNMLFSILG